MFSGKNLFFIPEIKPENITIAPSGPYELVSLDYSTALFPTEPTERFPAYVPHFLSQPDSKTSEPSVYEQAQSLCSLFHQLPEPDKIALARLFKSEKPARPDSSEVILELQRILQERVAQHPHDKNALKTLQIIQEWTAEHQVGEAGAAVEPEPYKSARIG